ncbi:PREDICTED: protein CASP-like [Amphimedon queenslandica]|uniref:Protein CASP n=1 Tax=Amphimedon queenslandica TaxID=400682 RepID=A0A1X7VHG4_AMPQE|nr:PREDICTED: protein CASP-like [Amphimedon queenslandica]|eukprot:XP_003384163.1 PREDICTED: protein CASP-like [Amphimedon queenslandica]
MAYQSAIQFWKTFDLHSLQKQLDEEATEVARRQDESDLSVRKLVELSKEFKKNSNEEVRKAMSPILRAFQSEIDSLTRRASTAETHFLNAYKKFIEIPDPSPLLESAVGQHQKLMNMQDLAVENSKLRETLDEYTKEFAQVKNQATTINKLKNQIKELENSIEEKAKSKAKEQTAQLMETFEEKEREFAEVLSAANSSTKESVNKCTVLQAALESTQAELFELKNKLDENSSAKLAEMDILVTDLDRANQRAQLAEKELERLQTLTQQKDTQLKSSVDTSELELELKVKDKELTSVREDVERLQKNLLTLRDKSTNQIELLEKELRDKGIRLSEAERLLSQQEDYEEIKKELNIMRSVEFSHSSQEATPTSSVKPLEVLLLEKNRGLMNENTRLKTELSELRIHFSSLQRQHNETLQSVQDQQLLINQLETDLAQIQPYLPPRPEAEGQASSSEFIAEAVKDIHPERNDEGSLLAIVTSQRERLKQRNMELEAECQEHKQSAVVLQREVDTLRGDNVKLYEKVRFLQTYSTTTKPTGDDLTSRYSSQYEARLDPFAAFSSKERQRKYMQLSGPDKATLILGRFILSNKVARMITFFYIIIIHLIIMLVLAKLVNTASDSTIDLYTECAKKFSQHMSVFHDVQPGDHHLPVAGEGG